MRRFFVLSICCFMATSALAWKGLEPNITLLGWQFSCGKATDRKQECKTNIGKDTLTLNLLNEEGVTLERATNTMAEIMGVFAYKKFQINQVIKCNKEGHHVQILRWRSDNETGEVINKIENGKMAFVINYSNADKYPLISDNNIKEFCEKQFF